MPELWNKSKFHVGKVFLNTVRIVGGLVATPPGPVDAGHHRPSELVGNLVILAASVVYALAANKRVKMEVSYEDCDCCGKVRPEIFRPHFWVSSLFFLVRGIYLWYTSTNKPLDGKCTVMSSIDEISQMIEHLYTMERIITAIQKRPIDYGGVSSTPTRPTPSR